MKKIVLLLSALVLSAGAFSQTLVAHWNFNNGSATDVSGHNLNGSTFGGITTAAGRDGIPNTAALFNGVNGYISVPADTAFNLSTWTLTALVKPMGFYSGTCQANVIFDHSLEYGNDFYRLGFWDNAYDLSCYVFSPNNECFYAGAAGSHPGVSTNPNYIDTGVWYCVVSTYANDTCKVYVDGVLQTSTPWTNQYNYQNATPKGLFIGSSAQNTSSYPYWFNGVIDDIQIWNGAFTADSILAYCGKHEVPDTDTVVTPPVDTTGHTPTGVSAMQEASNIALAPNPASNLTKVILPVSWVNAHISVLNTVGQVVMTQSVSSSDPMINIQALPAGTYIVRIEYNGVVVNRRLVKQ